MTYRYRAVIFDMDGVLVDSEPAFYEAVNLVLGREGKRIDWSGYERLLGTSVEVTWHEIIDMLELRAGFDAYLRAFNEVLVECLRRPRLPLPGVIELLDSLDRAGVPFALATSSIRPWYEAVMESCGLAKRFTLAVTADEVEHTKPAPDMYLRTAQLLAVPPDACIAIEDTKPGIASAKAAGMYAVQVQASSTALSPIAEADLVIHTLRDFPWELVAGPVAT
jgi:HAD superfamily hydrolase (TIGR01509 family)